MSKVIAGYYIAAVVCIAASILRSLGYFCCPACRPASRECLEVPRTAAEPDDVTLPHRAWHRVSGSK